MSAIEDFLASEDGQALVEAARQQLCESWIMDTHADPEKIAGAEKYWRARSVEVVLAILSATKEVDGERIPILTWSSECQ